MPQQWMGFTISIDCGPMGVFQGLVTAVEAEPQSVTLSRVFHNGKPHTSPSIVISAHDIKDLTIIAAPQAQSNPVVELKKPIPTRPGRNVTEGIQNFHSQPAPPRALHLNTSELDPRKAAVLQSYESKLQQATNGTSRSPNQSTASRFTSEQMSAQAADHQRLQLSALQAALPAALKISVANQAAALAASTKVPQAQGAVKLNAAQAVSQRALQLSIAQALQRTTQAASAGKEAPPHGGFKMTAALEARGPSETKPKSPKKSRQLAASQGVVMQTCSAAFLEGEQLLEERLALSPRSSQPIPLSSAAQALFEGVAARISLQGAAALPRPLPQPQAQLQGAAAPNSPQKNAHGFQQGAASLHPLPVNADGYASGSGDGNRTPNRRDRQRQRWQARDEACFGSPANGFDQEFDFEKNLALFDKQAVYDEMAVQRPDLVQPANDQRRQQNYRHDQNIIVNNRRIPTIIVPNPGSAEFVTDEGLIIPSMRPELLRQLHQKAHDVGFSFDRQSEVFARCATEMSLQLLGGAHRLNPHNSHQWPTVIIMVGPHSQGAAGVMCARQLECQGVSTVTLVVNETAAPQLMKRELNFYKSGGAPIVSSTDQLPDTVDLVIMALAGHQLSDVANSLEYGKAASWASNKRATVLALDPPPVGTPGIITKFTLAPTLPVTYSPQNGKIYLCNLGIPVVVFKEMGIRYRSPFGSKFVIPLHPNDE